MTFAAEILLHNEPLDIFRKTSEIRPLDILSWLEVQVRHPKFYWKSKDGTEEIAACGQLLKFYTYPKFLKFEDPSVKFFGYQNFTGSKVVFFLPTMEISRKNDAFSFSRNRLSLKTPELPFLYREVDWSSPYLQISTPVHSPDQEKWKQLHQKAISEIASGSFEKVVLARKTRLQMSDDISALSLFHRLKNTSQNSDLYYLEKKLGLAFFGASPERLFSRKDSKIECDILAGTTKRGKSLKEDLALQKQLLLSKKEQREFGFVQSFIEDRLSKLCSSYQLTPQNIYQTQDVQHLYAKCSGQLLDNSSNEDLIKALHPTPAMGGFPSQQACDFLKAHDIDRNLYSAPFGWISPNRAEILVAIRCASIEGKKVDLFSGTGIVEDSQHQLEWEEHEQKIKTLQTKVLGAPNEPILV